MESIRFSGFEVQMHSALAGAADDAPFKLPYHCGMQPSVVLDPKKLNNPLCSTRTYALHAYDHDADTGDDSPLRLHQRNWQSAGAIAFKGDGASLTVAGHKVKDATWNPATSVVSWATQGGAVPAGRLSFADNCLSALGAITDQQGQEVTVAGTNVSYYTTKRYKASEDPSKAVEFAVLRFGAGQPHSGAPLEPIVVMDFKPGQNPALPEGGEDDVSDRCTSNANGGFGDPLRLAMQYSSASQYGFDVTFDFGLETFTGKYYEGVMRTEYVWIGVSAPPPTPAPAAEVVVLGPQVFAISADSEMENAKAADGPALSLQALLHLSSLTVADEGTPEKPAKVVKDSAQEQANNVFQRIMLNNIPDKPRQALFPGLAPLTPEEKAVSDKNAAFYKEGSIAYVSQYLASAQEVDADTKSHINNDRVKLFWDAVGSFGAPDPNKDPVKQYGWDRNSEAFKNIQGAFVSQNLDTYKIGYKQGVPAFRPYLDDPKKWHDELAAYLSDGKFLARWAYRNSVPGYTDGHRQVYEWQTQLSILQREAEARGLTVQRQTQDVANSLTTAILLPKFDEVNWTDDMKQQYELQVKSIMAYSDKELEEIKKRNAEEYARIMAIKVGVQVHGTVDHFVMAADQALRGIEKIYLDKWNKSLTAGDLLQIQEKYRDAFIVAGENVQSEQFIQIVGEGYVKEVAESLSPHASKWKTWAAKAKEWGSSIKAAAKPLLYAAGVGVVIYALCGGVIPLTPVEIVSLTGIAIALSIQTLSSFAVTQLGAWVSKKILNPTAVGTILGQWFTQKGVSVVDKSSKLAKIFTPSSAEFLVKRLGPLMALVAVGTSIYNLVQAINHGTTSDIVYNSIFLGLAIIETAVVAIGLFASHTAIAAFCGPIGIAVAAIGFIVAIISLFVHDKPVAPNPAKDFVNGVCKDAGFFK